ncbi:conserved protein of unknown function [Oenococcus oeni]|uniref:Uncharacterized protein n=1 Tax=Oenococcus oeni AWRIB429 TaxID=655225 RepID=D3L8J4_OENOE|nr:hypothetical protein AWRIB429_0674 [Oenococcus oeni AWRIB429]KZD13079.1 hypothetical protein AC229_1303 [Oenococcus oeni]SYW07412.1 conserved hypothetical protein [Oenococcus oeni]SYW18711.1 conserved hypothetical protein [Oenococcus oeni]VDC14380.1 conserved protein of unknown function [Oenococcus oeni]
MLIENRPSENLTLVGGFDLFHESKKTPFDWWFLFSNIDQLNKQVL